MSEQFFQPGDKVMRVATISRRPVGPEYAPKRVPQFGEILCVEDCWGTTIGNQVMFAGFGGPYFFNGRKTGWQAEAFRKVEEIKLCLAAVAHQPAAAPITSPPSPVGGHEGSDTLTSRPVTAHSRPSALSGLFFTDRADGRERTGHQ